MAAQASHQILNGSLREGLSSTGSLEPDIGAASARLGEPATYNVTLSDLDEGSTLAEF
jgi:hypothetical protein